MTASSVLQLVHPLERSPDVVNPAGIRLRTFEGVADVEAWLALRRRAFARERLGVTEWSAIDFEREMLSKWWWRPEHFWLAETGDAETRDASPSGLPSSGLQSIGGAVPRLVGSVILARRGPAENSRPVAHWLAVLPEFRRHGVGRLLISALERACWDAGEREVWLETHAAWRAAAGFYQSLGYRPLD